LGKHTFLEVHKAQIRNLQLIPLSQIRKLLRRASPQIANQQIFMSNLKIANLQISTKYRPTHVSKQPQKWSFSKDFSYFVQI
jgi:hypothetical protein